MKKIFAFLGIAIFSILGFTIVDLKASTGDFIKNYFDENDQNNIAPTLEIVEPGTVTFNLDPTLLGSFDAYHGNWVVMLFNFNVRENSEDLNLTFQFVEPVATTGSFISYSNSKVIPDNTKNNLIVYRLDFKLNATTVKDENLVFNDSTMTDRVTNILYFKTQADVDYFVNYYDTWEPPTITASIFGFMADIVSGMGVLFTSVGVSVVSIVYDQATSGLTIIGFMVLLSIGVTFFFFAFKWLISHLRIKGGS